MEPELSPAPKTAPVPTSQPAQGPAAASPTPPATPPPVKHIRAPDPTPNPLATKNPPAPAMAAPKRGPGRPRKDEAARGVASASPPAPGAPGAPGAIRVLPDDPAARELELAKVRPTATVILHLLDAAATRLPPYGKDGAGSPLSAEERSALAGPLEQVIWKYEANMSPEWMLGSALLGIAVTRYMAWKLQAPDAGPFKPPEKAAAA